MATRRIETTIALDGEQAFKKGLAAAAREMRVLESESKALAASFGTSGDAAAAAAAKQRNLQHQVAQQEQIVSALEQAVKDAAKAYGESSAEVDGYAIKLNNARTRLANLQKALVSSDREVEELGRDAIKAGRQIEDGIGDGAREAQNELTDMMTTMQDSLSAIQSNTAVTAIKTVWDTATGAFNAIDGFVTGTTDYRRQLSFLIQNAGELDFGLDETEDMLVKTQTITADASAAIEGLSNLFKVEGMDEYRLNRIMENLLGAAITWPDTMKFESLAESFQETLATGQAVGQYGELLERLGVDLDEFNTALDKSETDMGDIDEAISYLTSNELVDAYNKYKEDNSELVKELETIARLEFQSARIGGLLARNITTPVKEAWSNVLDYIADTMEKWEKEGAKGVENKIIEDQVSIVKSELAAEGASEEMQKAAENLVRGVAGNGDVAMLVGDRLPGLAKALNETENSSWWKGLGNFGQWVEENVLKDVFGGAAMMARDMTGGLIDLTGLFEKEPVEAGRETGQQFAEGFEEGLDQTTRGKGKEVTSLKVIGQRSIDDALAGIDLDAYYKEMNGAGSTAGQQYAAGFEEALDVSLWGEGKEAQSHKIVTIMPIEAMENELDSAGKAMKDGGKEAGAALIEGLENGTAGAEAAAQAAGASFGVAYAQGIMSQVSYVSAAAGALAAAAAARAAAAAVTPSAGIGGGLNLALNLDGKTFARIAAPYMSDAMAVDAG